MIEMITPKELNGIIQGLKRLNVFQREVAILIAEGFTNQQIAEVLEKPFGYVINKTREIYKTTGVDIYKLNPRVLLCKAIFNEELQEGQSDGYL